MWAHASVMLGADRKSLYLDKTIDRARSISAALKSCARPCGLFAPLGLWLPTIRLLCADVLQSAVHVKMYGLAYVTAASPQPGSSFSADGEVRQGSTAPLQVGVQNV